MSNYVRRIDKHIPLRPCPLCNSPVAAEETIKEFDPVVNINADAWAFNVRFLASCSNCFLTLDVTSTFAHEDLDCGEEHAEEFLRSQEGLWNREVSYEEA